MTEASSSALISDQVRRGRPQKRLAPAITGGNWKGYDYLAYAEHDRCIRAMMRVPSCAGLGRSLTYDLTVTKIIEARKKRAA